MLNGWFRDNQPKFVGWAAAATIFCTGLIATKSFADAVGWVAITAFLGLMVLYAFTVCTGSPALKRRKVTRTTPRLDEKIEQLISSGERYCLLLRPFGSDGALQFTHRSRVGLSAWLLGARVETISLEGCIRRAANTAAGCSTYAIVDQSRVRPPAGPTYIRASDDSWDSIADKLVQSACAIAIVLPPGESLRPALKWEIERIVDYSRQSRVIIVLPTRCTGPEYEFARSEASRIIAKLRAPVGRAEDTLMQAKHWRESLINQGYVLTIRPAPKNDVPRVLGVFDGDQNSLILGRGIAASTYESCLVPFFQEIVKD